MKATRAEVSQRVETVLKIRLLGGDFDDIRQYAAGDATEARAPWDVSERQLWRYIAASDKLLEQRDECDRKRLLRRHLAQRRTLYARAVEAGDWRAALSVLKDEADLQGLYGIELNDRIAALETGIEALRGTRNGTAPKA